MYYIGEINKWKFHESYAYDTFKYCWYDIAEKIKKNFFKSISYKNYLCTV